MRLGCFFDLVFDGTFDCALQDKISPKKTSTAKIIFFIYKYFIY
jgi:hypothetical protein